MNYLFVYNKKAGKRFEPSIVNQISALKPQSSDFSFIDIRKFESIDTSEYHVLCAIGGDGTVSTVAKIAHQRNQILGIIPKGSGDGLARFLKIPRHTLKALEIVLHGKQITIDTAKVSNYFFLNVAGAGFEAEVAHKFGAGGIRGLTGYAKTIIQCFGERQEKKISIVIDDEQAELPFFSLSIANGAQWGNNFEIASKADIQDGLLEIAIMKKPKWYQIPSLISFLKRKVQKDNALFTFYKASHISIKGSGKQWHIDGEPITLRESKDIKVDINSLKVLVPK